MNIYQIILLILAIGFMNLLFVATGYYICSRSRIVNIVEGKEAEDLSASEFKISDLLKHAREKYPVEEAFVPNDKSESIY